jgi:zinc transport system permease protein
VAAAAALAPVRRERLELQDAAIGVLWAVGMAVGVLLLARGPVADADVESILFGDIASVRAADLSALAVLDLAVLAAFALAGRALVATAFDAEHARLRGLPVGALSFGLLLMVALSVVALLALVGVALGIALLAIPPLAALRLWRGLGAAIAGAGAIALATSVGGLALAARAGLPAGPTIVLLGAAVLGFAHLAPRRALRRGPR